MNDSGDHINNYNQQEYQEYHQQNHQPNHYNPQQPLLNINIPTQSIFKTYTTTATNPTSTSYSHQFHSQQRHIVPGGKRSNHNAFFNFSNRSNSRQKDNTTHNKISVPKQPEEVELKPPKIEKVETIINVDRNTDNTPTKSKDSELIRREYQRLKEQMAEKLNLKKNKNNQLIQKNVEKAAQNSNINKEHQVHKLQHNQFKIVGAEKDAIVEFETQKQVSREQPEKEVESRSFEEIFEQQIQEDLKKLSKYHETGEFQHTPKEDKTDRQSSRQESYKEENDDNLESIYKEVETNFQEISPIQKADHTDLKHTNLHKFDEINQNLNKDEVINRSEEKKQQDEEEINESDLDDETVHNMSLSPEINSIKYNRNYDDTQSNNKKNIVNNPELVISLIDYQKNEQQNKDESSSDDQEIEITVSEVEPVTNNQPNSELETNAVNKFSIETFKDTPIRTNEQLVSQELHKQESLQHEDTNMSPEVKTDEKNQFLKERTTEMLQKVEVSESDYSPSPSASEVYKSNKK